MKKSIQIFISIMAIFVLINILSPKTTQAYDEYTIVIDGIEWHYNINSDNEAINVYARLDSSNSDIDTVTVPSKIGSCPVVSIGKYPYYEYNLFDNTRDEQIKKVIIPDTVREIKRYCFINCIALESVEIPDSVEFIGNKAFYHCENLTSEGFNLPEGLTTIEDYAFHSCYSLNVNDIEFPESLESIGNYAFYNCKSLTGNLNLPDSLKTLGKKAFVNCSSLDGNITIGSGLTVIPEYAFQNCSKLTGDLNIPATITEVGKYAFDGCESLNGVLNYNSSDATIDKWTFADCNFSRINLSSTVTNIDIFAFENARDIWVDNTSGAITFEDLWGGIGVTPYVHYKDCKHTITVTAPEGVKVIDKNTGKEITTGEYDCETAMNLAVDVEDISKFAYLNMTIKTDGEYENSAKIEEKIDLLDNPDYIHEITSLTRNKSIQITGQDIKLVDLELIAREYIYQVNGTNLTNTREPSVVSTADGLEYRHTKYPLEVGPQDLVTYKIRIYNEGTNDGYAKEIVQYLPEGLEFVENNVNNIKYKWVLSEDKRTITTTYLENTAIPAYTNNSNPSYEEIEFTCKVTAEKQLEEDTRLVVAGEITKGISGEKELKQGNLNIINLAEYKEQEAYNSNSTTYVRGMEEDDDFENVVVKREIPVDYTIRIEKIDDQTKELLNGAKFELLNENKEVIKTGITKNGGVLDFGMITTHGTQDDIYYIRETETPEGYRKVIQDEVKVVIHKNIIDPVTEEYEIEIECDLLETRVIVETEDTVIPIYTEEQLSKIGSNENVTIDGKTYNFGQYEDYVLKNDIILTSENWTPIQKFSGVFDGAGYTISNLKYTQDGDSSINKIGLFAEVSGTIKDLNVENVQINIINVTAEIDEKIEDAQERLSNATSSTERTAINLEINQLQEDREEIVDKYNVGGIVGCMQEGTLQNCSVSGTINSDTNNVGGLVGLGANGKLLIINGCTNNANVAITGSKAGGLIGTGYGALSIADCTNNGTITAEKYNAGGLVGYEEASDYQVSNVVVKLDKAKNIVTLTVENKRHIGEYTLSLKNIDIDTYELIEGAKFNVLDKNKQIIAGYENIELENGMLQIATYDIEELGTDTYYVVQTQTPDGYVDVTEYVKVTISKIWNGKDEKYEVAVDIDVINKDDYEDDENIDDSYSDSRTNQQYVIKEADDVTWKVNKVYVKNSVNNGNVKVGLLNAGGIIGATKCIAELEDCTNEGTISSTGHSAGMIAEAQKLDDSTVLRLNGCINNGIITVNEDAGYVDDIAGLVSYTVVPVTINNCENNATITSITKDSQGNDIEKEIATVSGFIAISEADVTIKNSSNNGDMFSSSAREIAGFVAKELKETSVIQIENCENNGNIVGEARASGFIALGISTKININNSRIIGTQEQPCNIQTIGSTAEIGGFVAATTADIEILNCQVDNVNINTEGGYVGIIVGQVNNGIKTVQTNKEFTIKDCKVSNVLTQKTTNKQPTDYIAIEFGGILGKITGNPVDTLKIENCSIDNLNFGENIGLSYSGGIVGFICSVKDINLINNTVSESNFTSSENQSSVTGGIIAAIFSSSRIQGTINIENCKFEKGSINAKKGSYLSGIAAMVDYVSESKLNITGCTVNDSEIISLSSGNYGNMIAGILSGGVSSPVTDIAKCNVNNTIIKSENTGYNIVAIAGICAFTDSSINFVDCNVTNSDISTKNGRAGGMLALNNGYRTTISMNLEDCDVINTSIKKVSETSGSSQGIATGGLIGEVTNVETNIKNCSVISGSESSGTTQTTKQEIQADGKVGGFIGYTSAKVNIENSKIKNIDIKSSENSTTTYVGGMIGFSNYGEQNIDGIEVTDLSLECYNGIGGVWGFIGRTAELKNSNISNIKIKSNTSNSTGVGAITSVANGLNINNVKVNNIDIESGEQGNLYASGLVGISNGNLNISNLEMEKINIVNNSVPGLTSGIVATTAYTTNLENINMNNIKLDGNYHVGGLVANGSNSVINENNGEININNIQITSNSVQSNAVMVSTAIGYGSGTIKKVNVENAKINVSSTYNAIIGGIMGHGIATIDNCNVNSFEIITNTKDVQYQTKIGAIAGMTTANISNSNVEGVKINSTAGYSQISSGVSQSSGNIDNVNVSNVNITVNNTNKNCAHIGGIVATRENGYIANSSVEDATIKATNVEHIGGVVGVGNGNVINTTATSLTITNNTLGATVGGIVGVIGNPSNEIDNCSLNYSSITNGGNTYTTETNTGVKIYTGGTGGILGVGTGLITNCEVNNSNILSNSDTSYATGGIIGHGNNIKGQATSVQNSKVYNTYIEGKDAVGGIAGAAVPSIIECSVEGDEHARIVTTNAELMTMSLSLESVENNNSYIVDLEEAESYTTMIAGENYVGGIIGFAGQLTTTPNVERLAATLSDCFIKDIKVIGKTFVDEAIGKESYYSEDDDSSDDEILGFVNTRGFIEVNP